jgi:methyltransferase (TIGR00027 family)
MALFRALESRLPRQQRRFVDPLAAHFLSPPLRVVAELARLPGVAALACFLLDRRWPGVRTSAVARTWFIDERFRRALASGTRQVVTLGAGFDARSWRLLKDFPGAVFEVDHPATQARKRDCLRAAGLAPPDSLRFVPVDFARDNLGHALAAAGFDSQLPTFFVWEGVTNYLDEAAVGATLAWCASAAPGSEIVFTYIHRRVLEEPRSFAGMEAVLRRLHAAGEHWTFGFEPDELPAYLARLGLHLEEDVGAAEYRGLCYGASAARMQGYEFYRIARATVGRVSR